MKISEYTPPPPPPRGSDCSCADPGIFARGGGVQVNLTKKAMTTFLFLGSAYFTEVKWLISTRTIIFQGSRGVPFARGGVQLLITYRNPYNLWFSRGVRTPCPPPPPLWIYTFCSCSGAWPRSTLLSLYFHYICSRRLGKIWFFAGALRVDWYLSFEPQVSVDRHWIANVLNMFFFF